MDPLPSPAFSTCPCGTNAPYPLCCGPFHAGEAAPTALKLMRSRYSAYVLGAIDYLVETHDPGTRRGLNRQAVDEWARASEWLGLDILSVHAGGERDEEGEVEFAAHGSTAGKPFTLRERSRFRRIDGRWHYRDGVHPGGENAMAASAPARTPAKAMPTAGRNDPCPCGSGLKYKRCHAGRS